MKKQSWIIVAFMIFGVFASIDKSSTMSANGSPPEIIPLQVLSPVGNTSVKFNMNTGEATVSGSGDVSIDIEAPITNSVETRIEYVTRVEYQDNIVKSTKLINKLMPVEKPVLGLEKINPAH